jgi:hypothetical protein
MRLMSAGSLGTTRERFYGDRVWHNWHGNDQQVSRTGDRRREGGKTSRMLQPHGRQSRRLR